MIIGYSITIYCPHFIGYTSSNHIDKKIGYFNIPISYKLNKFFEI